MKRICFYAACIILAACGNSPESSNAIKDTAVEPPLTENKITLNSEQCFQNILQRDTTTIEIFLKDSVVFGNLRYNRFEKDDNSGRFKGTLHNGIIKADYTFNSEGTTSVREVMFKLQDSVLMEGYGEMKASANKMVFKDSASVKFEQVYKMIECE